MSRFANGNRYLIIEMADASGAIEEGSVTESEWRFFWSVCRKIRKHRKKRYLDYDSAGVYIETYWETHEAAVKERIKVQPGLRTLENDIKEYWDNHDPAGPIDSAPDPVTGMEALDGQTGVFNVVFDDQEEALYRVRDIGQLIRILPTDAEIQSVTFIGTLENQPDSPNDPGHSAHPQRKGANHGRDQRD